MRISSQFWQGIQTAVLTVLVLFFLPACKPAAAPAGSAKPAAAKATVVTPATNAADLQYVSVFQELMPPKGRDPFFPNSHRRDPVPVVTTHPDRPAPPAAELILKGIVGAPNHRSAIINESILETGEEDVVRVPNGHVKVKCLEIGEDYAVVRVESEAQPRRLELNKKGF